VNVACDGPALEDRLGVVQEFRFVRGVTSSVVRTSITFGVAVQSPAQMWAGLMNGNPMGKVL
jgi:hypothetical protein